MERLIRQEAFLPSDQCFCLRRLPLRQRVLTLAPQPDPEPAPPGAGGVGRAEGGTGAVCLTAPATPRRVP
jgi:hypothetical protein